MTPVTELLVQSETGDWVSIERLWLDLEIQLNARGNPQRRCPDDDMLSDRIGHFKGDGVYQCRWCQAVWIED